MASRETGRGLLEVRGSLLDDALSALLPVYNRWDSKY